MIQFQSVRKSFGTQDVLVAASFTVYPGDRVGIVGPNGAGKSTIFELICRHLEPERGEVTVPSSLSIGYVRQQLNAYRRDDSLIDYVENALPAVRDTQSAILSIEAALPSASADERARLLRRLGELQTDFEHSGGYTLRSRAEATLTGLGFPVDGLTRLFRSFSGGWQIRAELARVLVAQPDILLLDEPTNYLDVPAVEWLRDYLKAFSGTLLLVSHDRYLLNSLTSTTLEVMGGQVTRYPGNYQTYMVQREVRHEHLLAAKKNHDRRRDQIERFVERFRSKATKAAQAQSRLKMLERLEEVEAPPPPIAAPRIRIPPPPPCAAEVLRLEEAGFSYDGTRWIFRDLDLRLERGDKAGVVGLNGLGKTTLLRLLAGKMPLSQGRRVVGHHVEVGYQSQDFAEVMSPDKTVYETAREAAVGRSDGDVRDLLGGFGFSGDAIDKRVQVLSGGEKVRLALARLLLQPLNLLLLDEPTTHLDIHAREALEKALREYPGTLCLVSHDIEFIRQVATSIYAVTPSGVRKYYGTYDYYREKLAAEAAAPAETAAPSEAASGRDDRRTQRREEARQRQEFARLRRPLEERIRHAEEHSAALESEQAGLYERLQEARPGTDFAAINRRLAEIGKDLETAMADWEEASVTIEDLRRRCGLDEAAANP
ncbi:MAG: ABC-F family ATP-binding cassette domain-containing protein [Lentisphaerae bacterium]|nr:ABC-F family ATP-binding cassette domain-containing protein [Lentisphaerota bacterium]